MPTRLCLSRATGHATDWMAVGAVKPLWRICASAWASARRQKRVLETNHKVMCHICAHTKALESPIGMYASATKGAHVA
eukprot:1160908-Pelagomonas_calceolata.AAC.9